MSLLENSSLCSEQLLDFFIILLPLLCFQQFMQFLVLDWVGPLLCFQQFMQFLVLDWVGPLQKYGIVEANSTVD